MCITWVCTLESFISFVHYSVWLNSQIHSHKLKHWDSEKIPPSKDDFSFFQNGRSSKIVSPDEVSLAPGHSSLQTSCAQSSKWNSRMQWVTRGLSTISFQWECCQSFPLMLTYQSLLVPLQPSYNIQRKANWSFSRSFHWYKRWQMHHMMQVGCWEDVTPVLQGILLLVLSTCQVQTS